MSFWEYQKTFWFTNERKIEGHNFSYPIGTSIINFVENESIDFLNTLLREYIKRSLLPDVYKESIKSLTDSAIQHYKYHYLSDCKSKNILGILSEILLTTHPYFKIISPKSYISEAIIGIIFDICKKISNDILNETCKYKIIDISLIEYMVKRVRLTQKDDNIPVAFEMYEEDFLALKTSNTDEIEYIKDLMVIETYIKSIDFNEINPFKMLLYNQRNARTWLNVTLDIGIEELKELKTNQRFYICRKLYMNYILFYPQVRYACDLNRSQAYSEEDIRLTKSALYNYDTPRADIIKNFNFEMYEEYNADDILSMLYLEFIKMVQNNILIKKCRNCGKYFIIQNMNAEYCNRVRPEETKPCSDIGSNRTFAKKIEDDEALKAYNKSYKTHYARRLSYKKTKSGRSKKNMSEAEFTSWYTEAKDKLDKVRNGKLELDEFKEWLKK